jgi:hypothetical protein
MNSVKEKSSIDYKDLDLYKEILKENDSLVQVLDLLNIKEDDLNYAIQIEIVKKLSRFTSQTFDFRDNQIKVYLIDSDSVLDFINDKLLKG